MSCPDCFTGVVMNDYKPTGTIETLHGRQTYIARPPGGEPKGTIIIISDAFGMPFPNNKYLCDVYASHGFLTYLPDFMDGTPAPAWMVYSLPNLLATKTWWDWFSKPYWLAQIIYGFVPFMLRHHIGRSMPRVKTFFAAVRTAQPTLPIGAAGFCWGGQHTILLAGDGSLTSTSDETTGQPYSDACFTAHPSNVSVPRDIRAVSRPLSIAAAGKDFVFTPAIAEQAEAILRQKPGFTAWEIRHYPDSGHGFAVRADPGNELAARDAEAAVEQAVGFYTNIFATWKPPSS